MATILDFANTVSNPSAGALAEDRSLPVSRSYNVDITAYDGGFLEFTANSVRTDSKSLYQIADELEKIASIIRSDVISKSH